VSSLFRVSGAGGTPREIPIGAAIRTAAWPDLLPDGKGIMFSVQTGTRPDESYIAIIPSQGGTPRKLIEPGLQARYASTGHIVYARDANLVAVTFDVSRPDAPGPPMPLVEGVDVATFMLTVSTSASRVVAYAISRTGTLIYSAGGPAPMTGQRTLEWVDRNGRAEALAAEPRAYMYPRISPDGTRVAVDVRDKDLDIWMWDLARQTLSRVTDNPAAEQYPVWMPDGKRLLFGSNRGGPAANIYTQAADGSGVAERLTEAASVQAPQSVSPDGARLIFRENDPKTGDDLWVLSLDKGSAGRYVAIPLIRTAFIENNADVSPDGRWVAYQSSESGQNEVYVRPFPNADAGRSLVSSGGGTRPVWARSGRELFYLVGSSPQPVRLMRVPVVGGSTFTAGQPQLLFEGRYYAEANVAARGRTYDVSPDGKRFLMIKEASPAPQATTPSSLVIVLNWFEELNTRGSKN
jgi:eukaryotic-like serine/threonine-protein kinase